MSKRPVSKIRNKAGKPKSFKSDGSPKKRWSTAERAAKGHGPRRSGGRPRTDRDERFEGDRPARSSAERGRNDRVETRNAPDSRGRSFARTDRWSDDRRDNRSSRTQGARSADRFQRDDRPRRDDRFEGRDRFQRDDRPRRDDRNEGRGPRSSAGRDRFGAGHHREDRHRVERREFGTRPQRDAEPLEHADTMEWQAAEIDLSATAENAAPIEGPGFADLGLPQPLVDALASQQITTPFPIQAATIPDALAGRDVLGRGRTGSGKTLGFGLPMLAQLAAADADPKGRPGAVVLVPTRELALQVADVLAPLAKTVGLSVTLIAGGMAFGPQIKAFDRGVDVVVATPGRLIDLMDQGVADLTQVRITVLDEADHMADLGFLPDVTTILDAIPGDGQRLLFSATLDRGVDRLVRAYLSEPVTHEVDAAKASVSTMEHRVLHVLPHDKNATTAAIANREGRTVIFVRTQLGADRVAEQLREAGVMAGALHGGLTQGARARILASFKEGSLPVLVATDVAARGIHVDDVSLVLQVDPPMGPKDYLHRAGRTARAGGAGVVASIVLPHQRKLVRRITGQAGVKVEPIDIRPEDDALAELTGASTPSGEAISEEAYKKLVAPRHEARGPKKRKPAWGRDDRRDDRDRPGRGGGFRRGGRDRDRGDRGYAR